MKTLMVLEMESWSLFNHFYKDRKKFEVMNEMANRIARMDDIEDILNWALPNTFFRSFRFAEDYKPYDDSKTSWQIKQGFAQTPLIEKEPNIYQ